MQEQICQQCNKGKSDSYCDNCKQKTGTKHTISLRDSVEVKASMQYADTHDGQPAWKRKYEELVRCLTRLQKLYNGIVISGEGEDSLQSPKDYARNFFRVSYELKEMLKKDPNIGMSDSTEKFCKQDQWVGLSVDIANQTKHGIWNKISHLRKTNKVIGQINTHVHVLSPDGKDRTELTIEIDGKKEDCLKMAEKVVSSWRQFLLTNNLIGTNI